LFSRLLPADDGETQRLEAALFKLPRRTMHKLVAEDAKAYKVRPPVGFPAA
jgi:hypothetical protein